MVVYYISIILSFSAALLAQSIAKQQDSSLTVSNKVISNNPFFVFLTGVILTFTAGFRWRVGTDYNTYASNYYQYKESVWSSIVNFDEPGIKIIAKLSSWIHDDYATMFLIASVITIGLSVKTISKYSTMFSFSILLFIFMGIWHGTFNGVRQYLACAILFAGHRFIFTKSFVKYLLVVLTASLFHKSALIMIFLYLVPRKKLLFKHWIVILTGILIFLSSYEYAFQFISNIRYDGVSLLETSNYASREVNLFRIVIAVAPLALFYTVTLQRKLTREDLFYINLLFVNAAVVIATMNSAYLFRFVIYTNIFATLAFPRLLILGDKKLSLLIKYIIVISYFVFWYVELSNIEALNKFQWIFSRP